MAHYAFLDKDNIVTEVITGKDETELIETYDPETWYGTIRGQKCIRTSYNGKIRKRYAGIGMTYREDLDAFITQKCHEEATLNETTIEWECPNVEHSQRIS